MYKTVISTAACDAKRDATWVIVDCRFDLHDEDWGRAQYEAAHIPSAVYAHLTDDLSGPRTGTNGRHPLPTPESLAATVGRIGIAPGAQVVVYDQDLGMFASRLWWLLRYVGHDAVAVLDGGWAKWLREGRPRASGHEARQPMPFRVSPRADLLTDVMAVSAAVRNRDTVLVDARAPERFEGRAETIDPVAGHIPGAVNRFYKQNVAGDGTLRPPHELREEFLRLLGGHTPDESVMYCGSGVTACHNLLALDHAGLRGSRLYPGSWSEWCADPRRPVATGE